MTRPVLRLLPSDDPVTDPEVVSRMAAGDIGALGTLYDSHAHALLRFVRKHSPSADAEDIVQSTFLRAVTVAKRFESASSARPWLFGISVQILRERRRSFQRLAAVLASLAARPASVAPEPSGARRDLERALARLSEVKRAVVLLAEVEGFSCPEIAQILGVPVGTVWTRLHHARRELKEIFEERP